MSAIVLQTLSVIDDLIAVLLSTTPFSCQLVTMCIGTGGGKVERRWSDARKDADTMSTIGSEKRGSSLNWELKSLGCKTRGVSGFFRKLKG